jgi:hypothetical protein
MDALIAVGELTVEAVAQIAGIVFDIFTWVLADVASPDRNNGNGNSQS